MIKKKLKHFINHPVTDIFIGLLIILSIVLIILEVKAKPGTQIREFYRNFGLIITAVFIIELSIRWYVANTTKQFLWGYWIDILSVLPPVRALRFIRVLRLLRIIRLGILLTRRSKNSVFMIRQGLKENILLFLSVLGIFFIGSFGLYLVEYKNPGFDSLGKTAWWSLFTIMSGEPQGGIPVSTTGKAITAIVMLGGFTFFAVFTGVVSAVMVNRFRGKSEASEMELSELENHFLICGWNRSVFVILKELQAAKGTRHKHIVVVSEIEELPELPTKYINPGFIHFVRGDYTSTEILNKLNVEKAFGAILLADKSKPRSDQDRDARTILAALTLERMNPKIFTCAELLNRDNQAHLAMAGVEDIIVGDEYTGNLIAHSSRTWGLVTVMDELLTATRGNQFYKIEILPEIIDLPVFKAMKILKKDYDATLISIETNGGSHKLMTNPPGDYILKKSDKLIVIAKENPVIS